MTATPARGSKLHLPTGTTRWGDFDPATELAPIHKWQQVAWATHTTAGGPTAKLVLLLIAEQASTHGITWKAQSTIADMAEAHRKTINHAISTLEARGLIRQFERFNKAGFRTSSAIVLAANIRRDPYTPACNGELQPRSSLSPSVTAAVTESYNGCNGELQEVLELNTSTEYLTTTTKTSDETSGSLAEPEPTKVPARVTQEEKDLANEEAIALARQLFRDVKARSPREPNPDPVRWVVPMAKLLRLDGISYADASELIAWVDRTEFWHPNIRSSSKFREQYDQLWMQSKRTKANTNGKHDRQDIRNRAAQLRDARKEHGVNLADGDAAKALADKLGIDFTGLAGHEGYIGHPTTNGHAIEAHLAPPRQLTQGEPQ